MTEADSNKRRQRLLALGGVVALGAAAFGLYWYFHARFYEATDDAYVSADLVQITSEVAGAVSAVHVDDTQHVSAGQLLVELDPVDARLAREAAEAELAGTVRQVRSLYAQVGALRAQIRESEVALQTARADLVRREGIADGGAVSAEEVQHARDQVTRLHAALRAQRENLTSAQAQTENTRIATHPRVLSAAARVREAALALARTRITAPLAGTVARRSVQIGARIAPGAPLMAVVPLSEVWVEANFKEVQLARLRVGQPVELHADIYGGDVAFHGRVAGLGAGSGSAFALLPPQNASGNWIKVVQRVPVRIALDPRELERHPLRVGLSVTATVDTHDTSGPLASTQLRSVSRAVPDPARAEEVEERIAGIIAANAGDRIAGGR
ncbi:MAG: efflux RND transporter periplasmic adaptor subunit [Gammaproteobacteria bacterium]|nr:efflux RND transporter periplasmic adaptor subunit [Gammaproteobacteria bacterium]